MWTWLPDRLAQALVDWLVSGKFITIFAALFGIGFAIQMDRAAARHHGVAFYARRMAVLLVIGLVHAFGLWWGDILVTYAICGWFLLLFRNLSQRAILRWAHVMYWFLIVLVLGFYVATLFGVPPPPQPELKIQEAIDIYARGTFAQIFALRAREWWNVNSFVFFLTRILGHLPVRALPLAAGLPPSTRPTTWTGGSARSASACPSASSATCSSSWSTGCSTPIRCSRRC